MLINQKNQNFKKNYEYFKRLKFCFYQTLWAKSNYQVINGVINALMNQKVE